MTNKLEVRVNDELLNFYRGEPDLMKEALTLYIRSKQQFLKTYEKQSNKQAVFLCVNYFGVNPE